MLKLQFKEVIDFPVNFLLMLLIVTKLISDRYSKLKGILTAFWIYDYSDVSAWRVGKSSYVCQNTSCSDSILSEDIETLSTYVFLRNVPFLKREMSVLVSSL